MDLQAILDAPSSDEDDDDYLQRYASSYDGGGGGGGNPAADLSLSATVSNLSSVGSVKERSLTGGGGAGDARPTTRPQQIMEDYQNQDDVLSGVSSSPKNPFRKGKGSNFGMMDDADILRDLEGEDQDVVDIVGQILRSSGARGGHRQGGGGAANLELERILREADANDDDDDDDDDQDGGDDRNPTTSNNRQNPTTDKRTDLLLQSILNEADDDASDSDNNADPLSPAPFHKQLSDSLSLSISGRSTSGRSANFMRSASGGHESGNYLRRLSSATPPPPMTMSHSMEVDAILNSVRDEDDDDSDDLDLGDVRNYSRQQSHQRSNQGIASAYIDDDDDTDENETDIGLNFNFSMGSNLNKQYQNPLQDVKYDENISMQYPLTRKEMEEEDSSRRQPQKEVFVHGTDQCSVEQQCCLTDYTADFLQNMGKVDDAQKQNERGNEHEVSTEGIITMTATNAVVDDDEQKSERLSALCLQRAEDRERRLLKPNTRNVVSPLTVKRRMKPKVELMTKSRMSSQTSSSSQRQHQSSQQPKQSSQHQPRFGFSGGIIQSKSMTTLGSQLLKGNRDGGSAGLPTALAVNSRFIAVGNQGGQVWVFDLFEQLKIILGEGGGGSAGVKDANSATSSVAGSAAAVTSIDLSLHGDFLLAGYGSGHVVLWDILKGAVLKRIVDLHSSSISSARFTSVPMAGNGGYGGYGGGGGGDRGNEIGAVSVDAGGLVNKLVFSRGWLSTYSVDHECLLDGTAGQILAMDTLPPLDVERHLADGNVTDCHPSVRRIVLIALSSGRSSFAVSVEPKVSVLHRWARPTTERIDPTIAEEDRLTQVSSLSSEYAPTYVSSYAASYASSYMSTSTYHSNATIVPPKPPKSSVDTTPVPYLPCLSWGWALVSGGGHSVTPILARAWGCCLQFLRANFPPRDEADAGDDVVHWPAFGTHDEFDASAPVVALDWLGKRSLVYLTLTNEFTIIDTVIMTMQERLDFSGMKLVYAEFALSRHHKGGGDGGGGGCSTFMNSIRSSDNRLLVLCQEEIKEITVLGMRRQIMSLEDGGQWLEALALALDHYESTIKSQEDGCRSRATAAAANDSVMTISPDPSLLTEDEIWMAELLMRYLVLAIDNAPESSSVEFSFSNNKLPDRNRLNLAESHFEMLSGVCMEFCIVTRRLDLLFGPIFRCFYEARYINVFLDVMETYVLNDRLKYIAPEAMVLFVAHCKDMKDLSTVERCLLHMDCTLMDFDSILTLLRKNELYTGLFHVYANGGLDDYISPLEILFEAVFDCSADASAAEDGAGADHRGRKNGLPGGKLEQYGYKAILYLRYCFSGKTFPKGDAIVPEERIQTLRPELFDLLLRESGNSSSPQSRNKSFRGIRALSYPYLRALFLVDAKAFLQCLAIVLDDPEARFEESRRMHALGSWEVEYGTDGAGGEDGESPDEEESDPQLLPGRQHLVNILSSIIMTDASVASYNFGSRDRTALHSLKAKNCYLDFLAKYLKLGVITAPKRLTAEVFIRLCNRQGASEDDVLSLLHALPRSSYELEQILYTVERAHMTRGALFLHKAGVTAYSTDREGVSERCQRHFSHAIDCHLKDGDGDFRKGAFGYARKECTGGGNASALRKVVLRRLPELVELDAVLAAHLVGEVFMEDIDRILSSLKGIDSGRVEYSFLHAIISGDLNKVDTVAAQELSANLTVNHHHAYLLLMAKFQPDIVYQYLSTNRNYRLNDALKLCQERNITDASAYLLERMGDVSGALKLMLENLDSRMITLTNVLQDSSGSASNTTRKGIRAFDSKSSVNQNEMAEKEISRIKQILSAVLDLCERNKSDHLTLDNERGPLLWFHVLDRLVNAKGLLRLGKDSAPAISTVLSELLLATMQRMISNVPLRELMHKITQDHAGSDLGEFREMLVSMLGTYGSELDVCSGAADVMFHDVRRMSRERRRLKVRGCFVKEPPPAAGTNPGIFKNYILDVGPAGICRVVSHGTRGRDLQLSAEGQALALNAASLLQHRRRSERHQGRRRDYPRNRRGSKSINLMTASECQFSSKGVGAHGVFGARQVGCLSETQHVGGLY